MAGTSTRERFEKAARIRREVDASLDRLADSLDSGTSEEMNAFLAAMARFHRYSFQNVMLIMGQRPDATRVAGFQTWKSMGRTVKKGEKGIAIFAPMRIRKKKEDAGSEPSSPSEADDEGTLLRFRVVHVFDVSQTEGEPLPEPVRVSGDPSKVMDALKQAVIDRGIVLEEDADLGGADGVSTGGRIKIRGGLAPAAMFGVLAHELAHEMLHKVDPAKRPSKTVRETEAEAVAHVVCESFGLEVGSAASDYIALYAGDRETLAASLSRIQKTACEIIESIDGRIARDEDGPGPAKELDAIHAPETHEFSGDIARVDESYSSDRIGRSGRVRKPFRWKGSDWVNVGQRPGGIFEVYRLADPETFDGETTTYAEKMRDAAAARADPNGFYHGMVVRHGQRLWVMTGPPVRLAAASELLSAKKPSEAEPLKKRPPVKPVTGVQAGLFDRVRQ